MINVTFQGDAGEVSKEILEFIAGLQLENGAPKSTPVAAKPAKEKTKKETTPSPEPEAVASNPAPEQPKEESSEHTQESIRALADAKREKHGTPAVKAVISELGFKKLPEITPDKYQEFVDKLNAMQ